MAKSNTDPLRLLLSQLMMTESGELIELRDYQKEVWSKFESSNNYLAYSASRRLGKDVNILYNVGKYAEDNPRVNIVYLFITQEQATEVLESNLADEKKSPYLGAVLDTTKMIPTVNGKWLHNGNKIRYNNGSTILFSGVGNADSKLGTNVDLVVFSEAGPMGKKFEDLVSILGASMALTGGRIIAISTPRFGSYFNKIFLEDMPGWDKIRHPYDGVTLDDGTPVFDENVIDRFQKSMSYEKFQQEFCVAMDIANEASIYASSLNDVFVEEVELLPNDNIYIALDTGISDSSVFVFAVEREGKLVVFDWYENHSEASQHYIDVVNAKLEEYDISKSQVLMIAPHDFMNRTDALHNLTTRASYWIQAGYNVIRLRPQKVQHGIECLRASLQHSDMVFEDNVRTRQLVAKLKEYEYGRDKNGDINYKPIHGSGASASNAADAVEYMAIYKYFNKYIDNKKQTIF